MAQEMGGSQVTALLETVPGIASVLRSPTADALVNIIRSAAGLAEFRVEDTQELIQYAVRRGLIGSDEGERLTVDMQQLNIPPRAARPALKVVPKTHSAPRAVIRKAVHKAPKRPAAKKPKAGKKRRA
jgi:hypothetical protein